MFCEVNAHVISSDVLNRVWRIVHVLTNIRPGNTGIPKYDLILDTAICNDLK